MKLSWELAALSGLATVASRADAYASHPLSTSRPSSALRGKMSRRPLFRTGSLTGPKKIFREMDEVFDRNYNDIFDMRLATPFLSRNADIVPSYGSSRPYMYKITEDDDKFQLTADVPGVKASDMNIQLEQDGRVLRLSGMREIKNGEMTYESKFDKAFVLNRNVDTENITARLANGVITIDAPKKAEEEKKTLKIPIKTKEEITDAPAADAEETKQDEFNEEKIDAKLDSMVDEIKKEGSGSTDAEAKVKTSDIPEKQPNQEKNEEGEDKGEEIEEK